MADFTKNIFQLFFRKFIDMRDNTYAERVLAHPPFDLLTDGGDGPSRRLRVDPGQTGFFAGRMFRTFKEFSIAAGATYTIKFVVPKNVILWAQEVEIDAGSIRVRNANGGTESGTFSEVLPIIPLNAMSERPTPIYAPTVTAAAGGAHSGGFEFDVRRAVASNATAQQATVNPTSGGERGVAASTYYVSYQNFGSGTATGTLWFIWEERG